MVTQSPQSVQSGSPPKTLPGDLIIKVSPEEDDAIGDFLTEEAHWLRQWVDFLTDKLREADRTDATRVVLERIEADVQRFDEVVGRIIELRDQRVTRKDGAQ